jgi:hypothetical protein
MTTILRLLGLALFLSGWVVAALCLHIVRTPNPTDPNRSNLVVVPKLRLGIEDTYVDARHWTPADVPAHAGLVGRILDAGKAQQLGFLTNPKSKEDVQSQLSDLISGAKAQLHTDAAWRNLNVDISF